MNLDPQLKQRLDTLVNDHNVVLFMKGNRRMPQCGFSATVVGILDGMLDQYETVDVLSNPDIRQGIKEYSDWPTLPQLYIGGEFQGGCDIVREMAASGELHQALGVEVEAVEPPNMTLTDSAAAALAEAVGDLGSDFLRFKIPANYHYELAIGPRGFGDVEVPLGKFVFLMDPASAKRGEGTVIDHVSGPMGSGFQISNPAEPPKVQALPVTDLKAWKDAGEPFTLVDVRSPQERATASIEGSLLLDEAGAAQLEGMDRTDRLVFFCHHGVRSQQAAQHFLEQGFTQVYNLTGGIDAWSRQVDAEVPLY